MQFVFGYRHSYCKGTMYFSGGSRNSERRGKNICFYYRCVRVPIRNGVLVYIIMKLLNHFLFCMTDYHVWTRF